MKIEFLYSDLANLFGERGDMDYLRTIFPHARCIETAQVEEPAFLREKIDLVFLAPMSERSQKIVLTKLLPYKEAIKNKIEEDQVIIALGNAFELFGTHIEEETGEKVECLGIFPFFARQQMMKRLSCYFLGTRKGFTILGAKNQFTQLFETGEISTFCQVQRGFGMNKESSQEGIFYKNFLGTTLVGPFLTLNPLFVKEWFSQAFPEEELEFPFWDIMVQAHEKRLADSMRPKAHG